MPETVWAIHNFEAEAEDEISFHIGEPIIITQKDELYQDGWWEGTNVRGDTGLFPMNYTVPDPPEQSRPESPKNNHSAKNGAINNSSISNINTNNNSNLNNNNNINPSHNSSNNNSNNNNNKFGGQQSANGLANGMTNLHINQNPAIASPAMSPAQGFGGANNNSSNGPSNSKAIAQTVEESLNDPQLANHPSTWDIDQVAYWLRWCGYGNVVPSFVDNEISGAILLELNLNNLKELDITSFGKRFNIMNAITTLKQLTKGDLGSKNHSQYGGMASSVNSMFGAGPNIPPRMASAANDSPRASYDPRNEYMRDNRQELQDPRSPPQPSSVQSPNMRHQPDYDTHSQGRNAALARSDTMGSLMSGDSNQRGAQRQSITSAYSSNSNNRGQWERNAPPPPPQMPSPAIQQRGPNSIHSDDQSYGRPPMDQPMDQYPRAMDRAGPMSPELHHQDQYAPEPFMPQSPPQQRKGHNPDNTNRQMNGKADPNDKIVSLDLIGKPDYAGWLKKKGDTYRTWKSRWFMLKGVTLYYMNSPKENASKDYINLVGYKIIQDENIYAGKYCFKAVHEELRNFYFYTESENDMKGWLKALMKVTIGRDTTAPVISSSNIPTIPLHVARQMAPRPPSPSKRNRGLGPNGQPMHPQQQQQQQQYDQKYQQQQQQQQHHQHQQPRQPPPPNQQLLDYDDQDSDGEQYLQNEYGSPNPNFKPAQSRANGMNHGPESPILQHLPSQQQRHSFVQADNQNGGHQNDDDPWRDEDSESFVHGQNGQQRQPLKLLRPDSELDSFRRHEDTSRQSPSNHTWTQEQYVQWMNRNLPDSVGPVNDMTQSLRSGVVLVRLIEQLSGEMVDKRIPNATYTLQMLENLLTAFKFMERVGVSTDGYTVKDVFNGNEEKIIHMFESIRSRFPHDAPPKPQGSPSTPPQPSAAFTQPPRGSPGPRGNGNMNRLQAQHTGGSEYEALYEEAARSTIG
ncbi:polar growth protein [Mortierella antarctica]|nr:polar growth protein [Mortierella antarctica]